MMVLLLCVLVGIVLGIILDTPLLILLYLKLDLEIPVAWLWFQLPWLKSVEMSNRNLLIVAVLLGGLSGGVTGYYAFDSLPKQQASEGE